jgi:signal transduction histidine kinase
MLLRPPRGETKAVLDPEQVKAKLEVAARQVERLSRLVSELMDVSKITAGRLRLDVEEMDLSAAVRDVLTRLREQTAKAQSPIDLHADVPVVGHWDRMRVEQVVTNLVTNALKFGAGKPITLAVEEEGAMARVVVRDQGIGIAPEDVERIFQRYEQAIASRAYGGLGLGLYIVRQIVEAHGGRILVESQLGAGSTFTVELPRVPLSRTDITTPHRTQHDPGALPRREAHSDR